MLRAGGVVAFPTETVYGLGADAENAAAVERIFAVKGRPPAHPLIVHLGDRDELAHWCATVPPRAWQLACRFWPGPLTMIVPRNARVPDTVTGGLATVGLRVPSHPVAQELLRAFGRGIAAPSANRFGGVSPTTAAHVRDDLGDAVDLILDGGPCQVGLESTIVDLSSEQPGILRPGAVTREELEELMGCPVKVRGGGAVRSPGQLAQHYAPRARVVVCRDDELASAARRCVATGARVAVFSGAIPADLLPRVERITLATSVIDVAKRLYAALREVDRRGCDVVLVTLPAESGLGLAVADRLRRAAGAGESYGDAGMEQGT